MLPGMRLLLLLALAALLPYARGEDAPVVIKMSVLTGLKFDQTRFAVKPGAKVTIKLQNPDQMIHNLVITEPGARLEVVNAALALGAAGPEKGYVPDLKQVLWAIKAVNPNASGEMTFTAPTKEAVYPYVCTFPGHGYIMYGAMYVTTKPLPPLDTDLNVPPVAAPITDASDHSHHILDHPVVSRTFLADCGPAAIAVGLPGGLSYAFDAGLCRLRYAWKGGYVDNTEHWSGKGEVMGKPVGHIFYRAPGAPLIHIGDPKQATYARWKAYEITKDGPVFHYALLPDSSSFSPSKAVEVHESPAALKETSSIIFTYQIASNGQPVYFVTDPQGGAAFASSAGTWKDGVLTLTPEQAAHFTLTMTEISGVEPLAYWSMNDLPFNNRKDPKPGVVGRAFTPGGTEGKPKRLATGIKTGALKNGATFMAWVLIPGKLDPPNALPNDIPGEPVFSFDDGANSQQLLNALKQETDKWVFHAETYAPDGSVQYYVNYEGKEWTGGNSNPYTWPEGDHEIYLGSFGEKNYLRGLIDEARIWDRVLKPDEIERIYTRESANLKGAQ